MRSGLWHVGIYIIVKLDHLGHDRAEASTSSSIAFRYLSLAVPNGQLLELVLIEAI